MTRGKVVVASVFVRTALDEAEQLLTIREFGGARAQCFAAYLGMIEDAGHPRDVAQHPLFARYQSIRQQAIAGMRERGE